MSYRAVEVMNMMTRVVSGARSRVEGRVATTIVGGNVARTTRPSSIARLEFVRRSSAG